MKGKISFSRKCNEDTVRIELRDVRSGIEFLEVEMTVDEYFRAFVANQSEVECQFKMFRAELVGKKKERKTIDIVVRASTLKLEDVASEVVKPYEVDGWQADVSHCFRVQRGVEYQHADKSYVLHMPFARWIDAEMETETETAQ